MQIERLQLIERLQIEPSQAYIIIIPEWNKLIIKKKKHSYKQNFIFMEEKKVNIYDKKRKEKGRTNQR